MWELSEDEFNLHKREIGEKIIEGALFIYPTDTIYGIGCDATHEEAVKNLRSAKKISTRPVSVIAPSREWIRENCEVSEEAKEWCDKLPGKYTFIFKLKNKNAVAPNVCEEDTLGVRIPDHWISEFVSKLGVPVVTTSANVSGEPFMTSIEDLDQRLRIKTDFAIDAGEIQGTPSKIVDLTEGKAEILRE